MAIAGEWEVVEVRMDRLGLGMDEIENLFRSSTGLIATCRKNGMTDDERWKRLSLAVASGAAWVDIDTESDEAFRMELSKMAGKHGCRVIASYHNFEGTPDSGELESLAASCISKGGDLAKIACKVKEIPDVVRLLRLYELDMQIISIGMGRMGRITRLAAPFLGAPFTYASYGAGLEAADGQIAGADMKMIYELLNK